MAEDIDLGNSLIEDEKQDVNIEPEKQQDIDLGDALLQDTFKDIDIQGITSEALDLGDALLDTAGQAKDFVSDKGSIAAQAYETVRGKAEEVLAPAAKAYEELDFGRPDGEKYSTLENILHGFEAYATATTWGPLKALAEEEGGWDKVWKYQNEALRLKNVVRPAEVFKLLRNKYFPEDYGYVAEAFLPDKETGEFSGGKGFMIPIGDEMQLSPEMQELTGWKTFQLHTPDLGDVVDILLPAAMELPGDFLTTKGIGTAGRMYSRAGLGGSKLLRKYVPNTLKTAGKLVPFGQKVAKAATRPDKITATKTAIGAGLGAATVDEDDSLTEIIGKMALGAGAVQIGTSKLLNMTGIGVGGKTLQSAREAGREFTIGAMAGAATINEDDSFADALIKVGAGAGYSRLLFQGTRKAITQGKDWVDKKWLNDTERQYQIMKEGAASVNRWTNEIKSQYEPIIKDLSTEERIVFFEWMTKTRNNYVDLRKKAWGEEIQKLARSKHPGNRQRAKELLDPIDLNLMKETRKIPDAVFKNFKKIFADRELTQEIHDMGKNINRMLNSTATRADLATMKEAVNPKIYEAATEWVKRNAEFDKTWERMIYENYRKQGIKDGMTQLEAIKHAKNMVPATMDSFFPKVVVPNYPGIEKMMAASKSVKGIKKRGPAVESAVDEPMYEILTGPNTKFNIVDDSVEEGFREVKFKDLSPEHQESLYMKSIDDYARNEARRSLTAAQQDAMRIYAQLPEKTGTGHQLMRVLDNVTDGFKATVLSGSIGFMRNTLYDNLSKSVTEFGYLKTLSDVGKGVNVFNFKRLHKFFFGDYNAIAKGDFSHIMDDEMIRKAMRSGAIQTTRLDSIYNNLNKAEGLAKMLHENQYGDVAKAIQKAKKTPKTRLETFNNFLEDETKLVKGMIDWVNTRGLGSYTARMENAFRLSAFKRFHDEIVTNKDYDKLVKQLGREKADEFDYARILKEEGELAAEQFAERRAADLTNSVYFDYAKTGHLHDTYMKRIWPFASFVRFNTLYHHGAFSDPKRLARIGTMIRQRERVGDESERDETITRGMSPHFRRAWAKVFDKTETGYQLGYVPSQGYAEYLNQIPFLLDNPEVEGFLRKNLLPIWDQAVSQANPMIENILGIAQGKNPKTGWPVLPSQSPKGQGYLGSYGYYQILTMEAMNALNKQTAERPDSTWAYRDEESGKVFSDEDMAIIVDKAMMYGMPLLYGGLMSLIPVPGAKFGAALVMHQVTLRNLIGSYGDVKDNKMDMATALNNAIGPMQLREQSERSAEFLSQQEERNKEREQEVIELQRERLELRN